MSLLMQRSRRKQKAKKTASQELKNAENRQGQRKVEGEAQTKEPEATAEGSGSQKAETGLFNRKKRGRQPKQK
jgi:hypothetical protein